MRVIANEDALLYSNCGSDCSPMNIGGTKAKFFQNHHYGWVEVDVPLADKTLEISMQPNTQDWNEGDWYYLDDTLVTEILATFRFVEAK